MFSKKKHQVSPNVKFKKEDLKMRFELKTFAGHIHADLMPKSFFRCSARLPFSLNSFTHYYTAYTLLER